MLWRKEAVSLETQVALAVFRHSLDGMLLLQNGVFTICSPGCEALYGRRTDEIIGRSPQDFSAPFQSDGRPSSEHVGERLEQVKTKGFSRFEWLNVDPQGKPLRCLVTLLPICVQGEGEVLVLIQSMAEAGQVIDALRHGLDELSQGDLSCQLNEPFREDYEGLRQSFNSTVDAFAHSMGKVLQTAQAVADGAEEIQRAAQDLSTRSDQQSTKVEATVTALRQIGTAMSQSAQAAIQANALVAETRRRAEESGAVVARTVEAMGGIETSSREISEIVSVIDGIAFQTNLLALNAGVEAARAGDAGRGFAVVASEVRALAQRSADAAKDIKGRIEGSAQHVASGVALVTETGTALSRIAKGVSEVSEVMSQIAQDTTGHADRLARANVTVGEMDQLTQSNAAMSEEASAAARGLTVQSGSLMQELGRFRVGSLAGQAMALPRSPLRAA